MNTEVTTMKNPTRPLPLRSLCHFVGYELQGADGEIGKVKDFLIDDEKFVVRYLVADTGGWFSSNKVLVSPQDLIKPEEHQGQSIFEASLTKKEIEDCPPLEHDAPVSRRYELEYARHHQHHPYWTASSFWGTGYVATLPPEAIPPDGIYEREENTAEIENCHLRSLEELDGYQVIATDGESGTVEDFIVEEGSWKIRYLVVKAGGWFSKKEFLLETSLIKNIDWKEKEIAISLTKERIKMSPEFDPTTPINQAYELKLYDYYGMPHRWVDLD